MVTIVSEEGIASFFRVEVSLLQNVSSHIQVQYVTTQNTTIDIFTAVRTSNLMTVFFFQRYFYNSFPYKITHGGDDKFI
jgi:hypothetical protein